jgi:hypothetical protein
VTPPAAPFAERSFRLQTVRQLAEKSHQRKNAAHSTALRQGWPVKSTKGRRAYELMAIIDGRLVYNQTCNVNSAISQAVDLIREKPPYNLNGSNLTVGVWDAGDVRDTHQEFGTRVTIKDYAGTDYHSTHVAGTIGAAGIDPAAIGMAPNVYIDSYDWTLDESEMAAAAASSPEEPGKIYVSNHSYGNAVGWQDEDYSGNGSGPHWLGNWPAREDEAFGQYSNGAPQIDSICYNAPYYLPFWAAGNDRWDDAPSDGTTYYYYHGTWISKTYNSATDPYDDGYDDGGFDTILPSQTAKNIVTVGAVNDAVTAGMRDLAKATMPAFSCWGPTDDGRIKPDIVCNGVYLYSPKDSSDTSYASYRGTSMAAPSAAGAAILLAEYYEKVFPSQAMRSSTLKALILHTADDLGRPGPDYTFGWGLLNAQAAAEQIRKQYIQPTSSRIAEGFLSTANPNDSYTFESDGTTPIRVTLCWTDPPAVESSGLDNTSPRLINDLDLRVIEPNTATTYYPYILNPSAPSDDATTGDNTIDNIEQVYIPSPSQAGIYTAQISHKSTLTNSLQNYSVIITGLVAETVLPIDRFEWDPIESPQDANTPFEVAVTAMDFENQVVPEFDGTVNLSGWISSEPEQIQIGYGTLTDDYPVSTYYEKRRTETIYLAAEIARPCTITGLALQINEVPSLTRNDWIIRMKHTTLNSFSNQWDNSGLTEVYRSNEPPGNTGWQYYYFSTYFEYDGLSNLMIDLSFDNSDFQQGGKAYKTSTSTNRSIVAEYDYDNNGPPTTWTGNTPHKEFQRKKWVPNIKLLMAEPAQSVQISPSQTTNFVDGLWNGWITVHQSEPNIFLLADNTTADGESNQFDVISCIAGNPAIPVPFSGAADVPADTVVSWTDDANSLNQTVYDVYFGTETPPTQLLCTDVNDIDMTCDPTLSCAQTYYWQVVAKNCAAATTGPIWSFTTKQPLAADFDANCTIDVMDLRFLAASWLTNDPVVDIAPPAPDGIINHHDFAAIAQNWLKTLSE